jgi:HAE1 family hydrophobic/amphiphilic exporter-1
MMMAAIAIFGIIAFFRLSINEFPDVDYPYVTVTTRLKGASPEIMELDITDPLEEEINTIQGIKNLTSKSSEGFSEITVEFELDRDIDTAAQDVRDKVAVALEELPRDVEHPVVDKLDPQASPIMWIAIQGNKPLKEISDYAHYDIKPRFDVLQGVGSIVEGASRKKALRVWLNSDRLEALGLTVDDVINALNRKHIEVPGGKLERGASVFYMRTMGEFKSAEEFDDLIIDYRSGAPITLKDVGFAEFGMEDREMIARYRAEPGVIEPSVGLGVRRQTGSNIVEVARAATKVYRELIKFLRPGMMMDIAVDHSEFVVWSIRDVEFAILFAIVLTALVVLFFLRSLRSTIIISLAIPTSFLGTFAIMYFAGFTLNNMTLLALSLAVGVVVDDAIIVLESIHRHMEKGMDPFTAASKGAGLVAFAATAATVSIALMFTPIAFMKGIAGRFFYEFGLTVSAAVLISLFVSLTLTPMLCSRWLRVGGTHSRGFLFFERMFIGVELIYRRILGWALRWRFIVAIIAAVSFVGGTFLAGLVGKELVPSSDQAQFMITLKTPVGSSLDYTDSAQREIEGILDEMPEVRSFFSASGFGGGDNKGIIFVHLVPKNKRARSQQEVTAYLRQRFSQIPGVFAFPIEFIQAFGARRGAAMEFTISGPDLDKLTHLNDQFMARLRKIPGVVDVDSDLELGRPMVHVYIDRKKAADLGVDVVAIGDTIRALMGGFELGTTKFKSEGKRYDIIVRLAAYQRDLPQYIEHLTVKSSSGRVIGLSDIVEVKEESGLNVINRRNRQRSFTLSANLLGNKTLGEAVTDVQQIVKEILPEQYTLSFSGKAETFKESYSSFIFALILSTIITYMILASLFDSFLHPFIVMLAMPLSFVGGFGMLLISHNTMNAYSMIGLILLLGLVKKNSVLLVDYTNVLRRGGMERDAAIVEASQVRLRPILMTAISTMFGVLPIAIGFGYGAEARAGMGIVTAGGMLSSLMLTLVVVPVFYSLLDDLVIKVKRLKIKKPKIRLKKLKEPKEDIATIG